jgi:hypothetical protein
MLCHYKGQAAAFARDQMTGLDGNDLRLLTRGCFTAKSPLFLGTD